MLLNTYPVLVSQDLVFHSKVANMQSSVSVIATSLGPLERLTEENVGSAMLTAEEAGLSRILVTDGSGRILYDTRETGSALGQYVFYAEVVQALRGYDSAACRYENGAFRTGGATPVMYRNQIIGAVYAYEYDTEQAELLEAIRSVREGAYSHRAAVEGRDELSQIAQEFNSLTDRLQTTEEARRRFVSDASHELKTPLAAIRLLTDSILQTDDIDPATTREFVADIGQEANRLSRITEDLLQLTRLDGDVLPSAAVVDPLPILEQVLRMMELIAEERGITLTYQAEEGCRILGSMDETRQIIYNLVDNAVKYNRDGGKVEIELKRQGEEVLLTVADEGVGIPEEELAKIFQRFYRVDKARSRAAGGTGLGLSIVRDTLEKRGGSISVANRPGGGAVFTVRWPQAEERGEQA